MTERLTAVLLSYNDAPTIERALSALLTQSRPADELIVIDDASTDDSVPRVERWAAEQPSIRLIRRPANLGVVAGLNTGLAEARGETVYFASADDMVLPGFFERTLDTLGRHPAAALCFSDLVCRSTEDGSVHEFPLRIADEPRYLTPGALVAALRRRPFLIASTTAVFRIAALREAGGFDPDLAWYTDWFISHVAGFRGGVCYRPEGLAVHSIDAGGFSGTGTRDWPRQRQILLALLARTRNADIRHAFRRAGALPAFDARLRPAVLARPSLWPTLSPLMLRRLAAAGVVRVGLAAAPAELKRLYRRVRPRERDWGTPKACREATRARLRKAGLIPPVSAASG